jgi:hypothetical protein
VHGPSSFGVAAIVAASSNVAGQIFELNGPCASESATQMRSFQFLSILTVFIEIPRR